MAAQALDDQRLGAPIGFRDEVRAAFVGNLLRTFRELRDQTTRFARNFDRGFQVALHGTFPVSVES